MIAAGMVSLISSDILASCFRVGCALSFPLFHISRYSNMTSAYAHWSPWSLPWPHQGHHTCVWLLMSKANKKLTKKVRKTFQAKRVNTPLWTLSELQYSLDRGEGTVWAPKAQNMWDPTVFVTLYISFASALLRPKAALPLFAHTLEISSSLYVGAIGLPSWRNRTFAPWPLLWRLIRANAPAATARLPELLLDFEVTHDTPTGR